MIKRKIGFKATCDSYLDVVEYLTKYKADLVPYKINGPVEVYKGLKYDLVINWDENTITVIRGDDA